MPALLSVDLRQQVTAAYEAKGGSQRQFNQFLQSQESRLEISVRLSLNLGMT